MELKEAIKSFSAWRRFRVKGSTVKGYEMVIKQFCLFVRNKRVESININEVMEWFNLMTDLEWEHNSFVVKAMALRKFFEYLRLTGVNCLNPELIPVPQPIYSMPRVATEENYQKLLAIIPTESNDARHIRNLALIKLYWDTGARNTEILSINLLDLDLGSRRAVIRTEKARSKPFREIFWTEDTNMALKRWLKKRENLAATRTFFDKEAVFVSINNQKCGQRLTNKGSGEVLRRYCLRAEIPYLNAHSFRHHMGHQLAKHGANNSIISAILGHSTLNSSFVYTQLQNKELREALATYR
jgi:integrase/recombinase XerD